METQILKIADIKTDAGTQVRVRIDQLTVSEYAEAMETGAEFPAPVVFHDGSHYFMADGFHRICAAESIGRTEIQAEVREGTCRDVLIFALGANLTNGLRRTNADKRKCVEIALREFADWTDRKIAETCGLSNTFVGKIRSEVSTVDTCPPSIEGEACEPHINPNGGGDEEQPRIGRDGKSYKTRKNTTDSEDPGKARLDARIRSWKTELTAIHSSIRKIIADGGPESLRQEASAEERHYLAKELQEIIEVLEGWSQILDSQVSETAGLTEDTQAPIEPGGMSPGEQTAPPQSLQDSEPPIEVSVAAGCTHPPQEKISQAAPRAPKKPGAKRTKQKKASRHQRNRVARP